MQGSEPNAGGATPMDLEAALERAGGEHSLLVELAGMCLADTPGALDDIRSAMAEGNAKDLQRAAHKLKGSLLVLAADPASDAAYELESMGARGALENASAALVSLEREIDRLRPLLVRIAESDPVD